MIADVPPVVTGRKIRVLVVDDSAFMRKAIVNMLSSDPAIEVIGTARDGQDGVDQVLEKKPDLVTLDVEMPRMNGLEALRVIMEKRPVPVLMLSSLTEEGSGDARGARPRRRGLPPQEPGQPLDQHREDPEGADREGESDRGAQAWPPFPPGTTVPVPMCRPFPR